MKQLLTATICLTLLMTATLLITGSVYRLTPYPALNVFKPDDCQQPCWHGIQVGRTTLEQARAMLLADHRVTLLDQLAGASGTCPFGWTSSDYLVKKGCLSTTALGADSVVRAIIIRPDESFRLGDAVNLFGTPLVAVACSLFDPTLTIMYQGSVYLIFRGDVEVVVFLTPQTQTLQLDPSIPLFSIRYFEPGDGPLFGSDAPHWSGFTRYPQRCSK